MNKKQETPHIDPALAVSIVALVLGEASEFEREHLEQLIDQRAELAAYRRQIENLHRLLDDVAGLKQCSEIQDAVSQQGASQQGASQEGASQEGNVPAESDADWKLSPDRRAALLAVLDDSAPDSTATVRTEKVEGELTEADLADVAPEAVQAASANPPDLSGDACPPSPRPFHPQRFASIRKHLWGLAQVAAVFGIVGISAIFLLSQQVLQDAAPMAAVDSSEFRDMPDEVDKIWQDESATRVLDEEEAPISWDFRERSGEESRRDGRGEGRFRYGAGVDSNGQVNQPRSETRTATPRDAAGGVRDGLGFYQGGGSDGGGVESVFGGMPSSDGAYPGRAPSSGMSSSGGSGIAAGGYALPSGGESPETSPSPGDGPGSPFGNSGQPSPSEYKSPQSPQSGQFGGGGGGDESFARRYSGIKGMNEERDLGNGRQREGEQGVPDATTGMPADDALGSGVRVDTEPSQSDSSSLLGGLQSPSLESHFSVAGTDSPRFDSGNNGSAMGGSFTPPASGPAPGLAMKAEFDDKSADYFAAGAGEGGLGGGGFGGGGNMSSSKSERTKGLADLDGDLPPGSYDTWKENSRQGESGGEGEKDLEASAGDAPAPPSGEVRLETALESVIKLRGRDRDIDRVTRILGQVADRESNMINGEAAGERAQGLDEKRAAQEPFSTFSLHVSDVSFKLAQAALTSGTWPEADTIRIEEFVNAFDYGDPLPGREERVACRIEQCVHPFVQQRNLMRIAMRTASAGRSSGTPLRLTLVLDNSGSMERYDRQQTLRRAFELLAQQLQPTDQVTLISFARQPRLLVDKIPGDQAQQLTRWIGNLPKEGGTNIEAALRLAFEKAREQQAANAQNRIILLTDGAVNLGDADPESLSRMVASMRDAGIAFDAAGIVADGLNDEVLEALTRQGDGRYYLLDSPDAADDSFARQIAGALRPSAKNVKVQVEFNPQRVRHYKLLGFEKRRLNKEDFRNDAVDAAEMTAAEAGVAVYQFEALPDGEGDIGSVSVRFRDLSTGQMVEERWPIPYESNAPRVDQAASSLRVATSAAMFAARLKGEPLGETVDLETLANLISELPESQRQVARVQQLQQMIQQARHLIGN